MLHFIRTLPWHQYLWGVVLVGGGLVGVGVLPSQAQAQTTSYRPAQQLVRPATPYVARPNLNTSAALINANVQSAYNRQHMPGWDWQRTYPYSNYNLYNPYNVYSPYYRYNYNYYPYYPYYPYYDYYPNVVYPYVSPYVTPGMNTIYP